MLSVIVGNTSISFESRRPKDAEEVVMFKQHGPETIRWIEDMPPQSVFWDVGAGFGMYSIYAMALGHTVVAVEPDPDEFKQLQRNSAVNNLSEGAVYTVPFELDDKTYLGSHRLDDLTEILPAPTYIKVGMDGLNVLRGAQETLSKVQSVIVETSFDDPDDMRAIDDLLLGAGLKKHGRHVSPLNPKSPVGMDHWHRSTQ